MERLFPGDLFFTGLYIHVPFCIRKCGYCAFYSTAPNEDYIRKYLNRIAEDLARPDIMARLPKVRSVFIGGGNPTSIGPAAFSELLGTIKSAIDVNIISEWTVETNPETFTSSICDALKEIPSLRISLGLQRLKDDELQMLCRGSSRSKGFQALERALALTPDTGIDIIIGIPGCQSIASDLGKLLNRYPVSHVSAYFLTREDGTPLSDRISSGEFPDPAETGPEELFETKEVLGAFKFEHYEISNFARNGRYCLHNLNYWHGGDFVGIGPAAVGTISGKRISQPASLEDWLGETPPDVEIISPDAARREYIMLHMRLLGEGLNLGKLALVHGKLSDSFKTAVQRHIDRGNIENTAGNIRLTSKGLPFANMVISDLF